MSTGNENKKKIGLDLDDVLMDFGDNLMIFHNQNYGTNYKREDVVNFDLSHVFLCDRDEVTRRVWEFYNHDLHHSADVTLGAKEFIEKARKIADLYLITARPERFKKETFDWLDKNFPNVFKEVYFVNNTDNSMPKINKSEVCEKIGIEIFVDDGLHNVNDVVRVVKKTYLFDKPWNREGYVDPRVKRVFDFDEVEIG